MARVYSFRWVDGGYLYVYMEDDGLVVEGRNLKLVLGLREVAVKGVYEGMREHMQDQRGTKKVVYLDLAFPIKGHGEPSGVAFTSPVDLSVGPFGLSYTPLDKAGTFLTIYPPPGSLYDYAVVAPDKVAFFMLGRRKVYQLMESEEKKLILV